MDRFIDAILACIGNGKAKLDRFGDSSTTCMQWVEFLTYPGEIFCLRPSLLRSIEIG